MKRHAECYRLSKLEVLIGRKQANGMSATNNKENDSNYVFIFPADELSIRLLSIILHAMDSRIPKATDIRSSYGSESVSSVQCTSYTVHTHTHLGQINYEV